MDVFQDGRYYKLVSPAEVSNIVDVCDKSAQALWSSATIDWSRNDVNRMRIHITRLKEELRFVLKQVGIDPASMEFFKRVMGDSVVPDTVADLSNKLDYSQARYRSFSNDNIVELYGAFQGASGQVLNRVTSLTRDILFTNLRIAKAEADMIAKVAARKEFEQKRDADKDGFKILRDQFLLSSEIQGYIEALMDMAERYMSMTSAATGTTVRAVGEQFDLLCWKWRRYCGLLERAIEEYVDEFADLSDPLTEFVDEGDINYTEKSLTMLGISVDQVRAVLKDKLTVVYNKSTKKYQVMTRDFRQFFVLIKNFISDESVLPKHYTQVSSEIDIVRIHLSALHFSVFLLNQSLENKLVEWSGGASKASSNPVVANIIDKARQAVMSPVNRTKVDPMTRNEYLSRTFTNFKDVADKVREIKQFLESAPDAVRSRIGNLPFDREFLRKVFVRRDMPVKGNMKNVKPVEDAVRERVRNRYGPSVPFEDEVNVSTEAGKFEWRKESLCEYKNDRWVLKTDSANQAAGQVIDNQNVSSSGN